MAINLDGKKTSLKDEASIYAKREENEPVKNKWKKMSGKQKRSYFATYYAPKLLIILAVLAVLGYIIWVDFINKANIYFRCAVLNEAATDGDLSEFSDKFTEKIGMDSSKNELSFYCYYTKSDLASEMGANVSKDQTEITSRLVSQMLGGMIADEQDCQNYLNKGFYENLDSFLTKDERDRLKDYLYYGTTEKDKEQHAYGIRLDKCGKWKDLFQERSPLLRSPIFFIIVNSEAESKEYARKLIDYLFS